MCYYTINNTLSWKNVKNQIKPFASYSDADAPGWDWEN